MRDWQIDHAQGKCAVSGRVLGEGDEFYTVIMEDGESFRRVDIAVEAWTGPPEGSFCHFKTRVPVKRKKRRLLADDDVLISFFQRLADESDPLRVQFRFVLALILMRKKLLRYDSTETLDGQEIWHMTLPGDQSQHNVVNPRLTDLQIDGVSQQLTAILHGDALGWVNDPIAPTSAEDAA